MIHSDESTTPAPAPIDLETEILEAQGREDQRETEKLEQHKARIYAMLDLFLGQSMLRALGIPGTDQWTTDQVAFPDPQPYGEHAKAMYVIALGEESILKMASYIEDDRLSGAIAFSDWRQIDRGDQILAFIANTRQERTAMFKQYEEHVQQSMAYLDMSRERVMTPDAE